MKLYDATPEQLKAKGLTAKDAQKLFRALCALADYEGAIKAELVAARNSEHDHANVCAALRALVDGE